MIIQIAFILYICAVSYAGYYVDKNGLAGENMQRIL
jgi:hypothetical protein